MTATVLILDRSVRYPTRHALLTWDTAEERAEFLALLANQDPEPMTPCHGEPKTNCSTPSPSSTGSSAAWG